MSQASSMVTAPSRRGREIAHLFRKSRGLLATRACDLDSILDEADLVVTNSERDDPGYAAALIRLQGGGGGIMLASNQREGRRRFSLAHELGHFFIPSHAKQGPALKCADADLRARSNDSARLEWEANDFASELLMPRRLFAEDVRHRPINFETVAHLSSDDMYRVSRTAAAWRLVQITRQPCAIVVTRDGAIEWVARSDSFRQWIPERGQAIGKGSVAAAINRGESRSDAAERVDPHEWFDGTSFDGIAVCESAHHVPSQDQIVSLIWVQEGERSELEDDDQG
jgi:Zn-dependent peptidase ImmA (M78 family)